MVSWLLVYSFLILGVNSADKIKGWREVEKLRGAKPVLVVGTPKFGQPLGHPCGDVTIDIDPRLTAWCPGGQFVDVRDIPYADKHFSVAFASHVIEHLPNVREADLAMRELRRVADHVVIISPHSFDIVNQVHPGHHLVVEPAGVSVDTTLKIQPMRGRSN